MDETRELGMALISLRRESANRPGMLTKALDPLAIKASGEQGKVVGHANNFWVVDSYAEATTPGSFAQTISDRGPQGANRILFRYEHAFTVGNHSKMLEDGKGLYIEADIVDDGMYGTVLRRHLAAENAPSYGLSIGWRSIKARAGTNDDPLIWDFAPRWLRENPDPSMVTVLEINALKENSAVSFPAVDNALIESYKTDVSHQLEQLLLGVKAGSLSSTQIGLLREIAAALPAATTPESGQASPLPGAKADSRADDELFAHLDLTLAMFGKAA